LGALDTLPSRVRFIRRGPTAAQWLAVIVLVIVLELGRSVPVSASAAVLVYDHGFAQQVSWTRHGKFVPINKTSSFTQDDPFVWAYFTAELYSANFTWQWYDPSGQLYLERTTQAECAVSPCSFVDVLTLAGTGLWPFAAATRFGLWRLQVLADGYPLYSDTFLVNPVVTEEDSWNFNVTQSAPPVFHGDLTVTIHPNNQTWSSYRLFMPYAANVTAFEPASNRALNVSAFNETYVGSNSNQSLAGGVVVNFGGARSDGYTFLLSFDLRYGVRDVNGWYGGAFSFTWVDEPGNRPVPDVHPIPETFSITLPKGSTLVDLVGIDAMVINRIVRGEGQPSVSFRTALAPRQRFGWALIYRDFAWAYAHPGYVATTIVGLPFAERQPLPVLPLTLGGMSLWSGMMSALLLVASEVLSPIYGRTGLLMNRRRLRIVALLLVVVFVIVTAYQLLISQQTVPKPTR